MNQEHYDIIKQGVGEWNKWREENPDVRIDLSGANLKRANLSGADLSGAYLSGAYLTGADLLRAIGITSHIGGGGYSFYFQEGVTKIGCYSKTNEEWLRVDVKEAVELGIKEEEYGDYKKIFLANKF
jgi:hypothetical protein